MQLDLFDDFIQPIHPDDFIEGDFEVEPISFSSLHEVPITLFYAEEDTTCPKARNSQVMYEASTEIIEYTQPGFDHGFFALIRGDTFLSKIVAAIESGDPGRGPEYQTSAYTAKENLLWDAIQTAGKPGFIP
jgi:hypothetical protein